MFTNRWDFSGRPSATFMSLNTLIYSYIYSFCSNSDYANSQYSMCFEYFIVWLTCFTCEFTFVHMWSIVISFDIFHIQSSTRALDLRNVHACMYVGIYICMCVVFKSNVVFSLGSENLETCMFTNYLNHVVCCWVFYQLSRLHILCVLN